MTQIEIEKMIDMIHQKWGVEVKFYDEKNCECFYYDTKRGRYTTQWNLDGTIEYSDHGFTNDKK